MNEYRRTITHSPDSQYWFVEMGPIPNQPDWHMKLYDFQSYPFPSLEAARRFSMGARERDWERDIKIRYPGGEIRKVPLIGEEWE